MSSTVHADPDGLVQISRTQMLKARLVAMALAGDDNSKLGRFVEQYADDPVVLGSVACLLAQELARLTRKDAAFLAALSYASHGLAGGD
jgi:hypothetical protein